MQIHAGGSNCPDCGYSWRGLPDEGRCPECGLVYGETLAVWRPRGRQIALGVCLLVQAACVGVSCYNLLHRHVVVAAPTAPSGSTLAAQPNWMGAGLSGGIAALLAVAAFYMLFRTTQSCYLSVAENGVRIRQGNRLHEEPWGNIRAIVPIWFLSDALQLHHGNRIVIERPWNNAHYDLLIGRARAMLALRSG